MTLTMITREAKDAAGDVPDPLPAYLPGEKLGEQLALGTLDDDAMAHLHRSLGELPRDCCAVRAHIDQTTGQVDLSPHPAAVPRE